MWYNIGFVLEPIRVQGPGRINFSGQFHDYSMFNPSNRSESILFYTLDTTSGVWMANLLHSPITLEKMIPS